MEIMDIQMKTWMDNRNMDESCKHVLAVLAAVCAALFT
jgi:hypothetical protein